MPTTIVRPYFLAANSLISSSLKKENCSIFFRRIGELGLSVVFVGISCLAQQSMAQTNTGGNMEITQQPNTAPSGKQSSTPYVRLAELDVTPVQIDSFKAAAIQNMQSTLDQEEGALEFHALLKRDHPGQVFVFEIYKNKDAYETHVQSPHYKQFGAKVESMINDKALYDTLPVILARKPLLPASPHVRIAELDIDPAQLEAYKAAVTEEIEASIRLEPGVLAIYSVALKDNPSHLRFLEFYANEQAYLMHRESPHFKKYLAVTKPMIKALRLFEAEPIRLGLKAVTQASVEI